MPDYAKERGNIILYIREYQALPKYNLLNLLLDDNLAIAYKNFQNDHKLQFRFRYLSASLDRNQASVEIF